MKKNVYHIFLGIFCGIIIFSSYATIVAGFKPENFGLGKNTHVKTAYQNGYLVNAGPNKNHIIAIQKYFTFLRQNNFKIALWLGASQLHAINHLKDGDMLAVEYANLSAKNRASKLEYLQISQGNANLNEILCMYLCFAQKKLIPDWVIVAVVYDDLREEGINNDLLHCIEKISPDMLYYGGYGIQTVADEWEQLSKTSMVETPHEKIETYLDSWLQSHFPGYRHRGLVRSKIHTLFRGSLLHSMKKIMKVRRVPEIRGHLKQYNTEALWSLVTLAKSNGSNVLIYKPPHPQYPGPFIHNRQAYDAYFEKLKSKINNMEDVYYLDLEKIVPTQFWGLMNDGFPDCYHFQDTGHKILGKQIDAFMSEFAKE